MMEVKDPGIKLFGKKISLPENEIFPFFSSTESDFVACHEDDSSEHLSRTCLEDEKVKGIGVEQREEAEKEDVEEESETKPQDKASHPITKESKNSEASPESNNSPKIPSIDEEAATMKPPETENDQSHASDSQQKTLKKPDKILPCPRCNSMDTKFCYYNNYNVNQPRHFCKSCQRYWTSGGTMRNVPVGAGRRKNKNSASHCRHITITEALQAARIDAPCGILKPTLKDNGTVLSFGSDPQLCESMPCVLNLAETKVQHNTQNGIYTHGHGIQDSHKGGEYGDDCSSGSSITTSNSIMEGRINGVNEPKALNVHAFPSQLPGVPWPCPWNSAVPLPAICPSGIPFPYFPTPYWNCNVPGAWCIPWLSPTSPVTNQKAIVSDPKAPILGKHSREGDLLKSSNLEGKEPYEQKTSERSVLVPKALRIDDPDEAAKSSIWSTLGIKNDSINKEGLLKAFHPKKEEKNHIAKTSSVLQANPAALSRSLSFQERV